MNEHALPTILTDLAIVLAAGMLGAIAARLLRLPLLVGYLAAGFIVGPYTPGYVANADTMKAVAELGVMLLMFAVGVQFSVSELTAVSRHVYRTGLMQLLVCAGGGMVLGHLLGWGLYAGLFAGAAATLSSTAVVLKHLEEQGEGETMHGRVATGILVLQDLMAIALVVLLPALSGGGHSDHVLVSLTMAILKAALFLVLVLVLATRAVPWLLERVVRTSSREMFVLFVVCLSLGAGMGAAMLGLSPALGAFLGGLIVSGSSYAHEILSQVRPMRDVFASVFFVSIGTMIAPIFVVTHLGPVLLMVLLAVAVKGLITMWSLLRGGLHGRTSVKVGMALGQMGEFSFVLAGVGATQAHLAPDVVNIILATALISIGLWPFLYGATERLYAGLMRSERMAVLLNRLAEQEEARHHGSDAVAGVLGCGKLGVYVSDALRIYDIPQVVVELDAEVIKDRKSHGIPVIYGDAASPVVLDRVLPETLQLVVITLSDLDAAEVAVRTLAKRAHKPFIIARADHREAMVRMRHAGADLVINAHLESAAALMREGLSRVHVSNDEIDAHVQVTRIVAYQRAQALMPEEMSVEPDAAS